MNTKQKGLEVLLEALAIIKAKNRMSLHVDMVGDGVLRAGYEMQAEKLGLKEMVTFHGMQNH